MSYGNSLNDELESQLESKNLELEAAMKMLESSKRRLRMAADPANLMQQQGQNQIHQHGEKNAVPVAGEVAQVAVDSSFQSSHESE